MTAPTFPRPSIDLPPLCANHIAGVRKELVLAPDDLMLTSYLDLLQRFLFDWTLSDKRVIAKAHGSFARLQTVLHSIGCLACYEGDGFELAIKVLRRGFEHAVAVHENRLHDPAWPLQERVLEARGDLIRARH